MQWQGNAPLPDEFPDRGFSRRFECTFCNTICEGNRQGYAIGLMEKYGDRVLLELDIRRSVKSNPWTRFEFEQMIAFYKQKVKELEHA